MKIEELTDEELYKELERAYENVRINERYGDGDIAYEWDVLPIYHEMEKRGMFKYVIENDEVIIYKEDEEIPEFCTYYKRIEDMIKLYMVKEKPYLTLQDALDNRDYNMIYGLIPFGWNKGFKVIARYVDKGDNGFMALCGYRFHNEIKD